MLVCINIVFIIGNGVSSMSSIIGVTTLQKQNNTLSEQFQDLIQI